MEFDSKLIDQVFGRNGVQIPLHTAGAMLRYLIYGALPGSFLERMMMKDVYEACFKADLENKKYIADIMKCIEFNFPRNAWGSQEKILAWVKLTDEQRRKYLEETGFLHTVFEILKAKDPSTMTRNIYD